MLKRDVRGEVPRPKQKDMFIETTPASENTKTITYPALKGWGDDSLTKLLYNAHFNILTIDAKLRIISQRLKEIHEAFEAVIEYARSVSNVSFNHFMFHRAHSAYFAGFRLSTAGQCSESYMVLRGCLELALYTFHFHKTPGGAEKWLRRHDDEDSMRAVKKEFRPSEMLKILANKDSELGEIAKQLYDYCIDYGAHPNEKGLTSSIDMNEEDSAKVYSLIYLNKGNSLAMKWALKMTAEVGVCCLMIFAHIFPEHFLKSGVSAQLAGLRQGL